MVVSERRRMKRDRRRSRRVAATFAVKNSTGGQVQLCQAEDICPGGMTIKRPKDPSYQPRMTVALAFALPGVAELIAAQGLITSDAASGSFRRTGVSFIALRPEDQRLIAGFCRRGQRI
jgi:PilZ domain